MQNPLLEKSRDQFGTVKKIFVMKFRKDWRLCDD